MDMPEESASPTAQRRSDDMPSTPSLANPSLQAPEQSAPVVSSSALTAAESTSSADTTPNGDPPRQSRSIAIAAPGTGFITAISSATVAPATLASPPQPPPQTSPPSQSSPSPFLAPQPFPVQLSPSQPNAALQFGQTVISVVQQDISAARTAAVVNAANALSFQTGDTGVSGALRQACAPAGDANGARVCNNRHTTLQEWSETGRWQFVAQTQLLGATRQPATGRLQIQGVQWVIHAFGPTWQGGAATEEFANKMRADIKMTVGNALDCAHRAGATSVMLPPISGGIFTRKDENEERDQRVSREAVVEAVCEYAELHRDRFSSITVVDLAPDARPVSGRFDLLEEIMTARLHTAVAPSGGLSAPLCSVESGVRSSALPQSADPPAPMDVVATDGGAAAVNSSGAVGSSHSPIFIQIGDWDETAGLYQSSVIRPDVVVVLLVPHSLAEQISEDTAMICICNMWTPNIQFETERISPENDPVFHCQLERHASFFVTMGAELLYNYLHSRPHISGIILTSLCAMPPRIRTAIELEVRCVADRDRAVLPKTLSQLRREQTRFYAQTGFYINSGLDDGQYYGWGPTVKQIDREVNQHLLGLSPPGKRRSVFDERAVKAFAGADPLGGVLSAATNLQLNLSTPPEPPSVPARSATDDPPTEHHADGDVHMRPVPTDYGHAPSEMETDEVAPSPGDAPPRAETYRVAAIRDLLSPHLQPADQLSVGSQCTLTRADGASILLHIADAFTLTGQVDGVSLKIVSDIGTNEKRLATYYSNFNSYHHLLEMQSPRDSDTRLDNATDVNAIVLRPARATQADELEFRAAFEGTPFNRDEHAYRPPQLCSVGKMGDVIAEFVCAPTVFDDVLMLPHLNIAFADRLKALFVGKRCVLRVGPRGSYSDPSQKPSIGAPANTGGSGDAGSERRTDPRFHDCVDPFLTFEYKNAEWIGRSQTCDQGQCELVMMPSMWGESRPVWSSAKVLPTPPPPPLPPSLITKLATAPTQTTVCVKKVDRQVAVRGLADIVHPACALVHGSCFDIVKLLPDGSVDLIMIDPPAAMYNKSHGKEHWAWDVKWVDGEWKELLSHVWRVLKADSRFLVFGCGGKGGFTDEVAEKVETYAPPGGIDLERVTWATGHNQNEQNPESPYRADETVLIFTRKSEAKQQHHLGGIKGGKGRVRPASIVHERKDETKDPMRPVEALTMKPLNLMRALIRGYETSGTTRDGLETTASGKGVVLDVCMRKGVCGRAAMLEGRSFIGVELEDYAFGRACQLMADLLSSAAVPSQADGALLPSIGVVATPPPRTRTRASTPPSESSHQSYFFSEKKPYHGAELTFESLTSPNGARPRLLFVAPTSIVAEGYFRPSAGYGRYVVSPKESAEPLHVIDGFAAFEKLKQLQPRLTDILSVSGSKWTRNTVPKDDYTIFGELARAMSLSEEFCDVDGLAFSQDAFANFHGEYILFERAASRLSFRECGVASRSGGIWSPPSTEGVGVERGAVGDEQLQHQVARPIDGTEQASPGPIDGCPTSAQNGGYQAGQYIEGTFPSTGTIKGKLIKKQVHNPGLSPSKAMWDVQWESGLRKVENLDSRRGGISHRLCSPIPTSSSLGDESGGGEEGGSDIRRSAALMHAASGAPGKVSSSKDTPFCALRNERPLACPLAGA
jgi:site-specific DNA-methyltransferase (adenine-specific)